MKLRIKNNSIRFRLTKSDVSQLATTGSLQDGVSFGASMLEFAVNVTNSDVLWATFAENKVTLLLPQQMVTELTETNRVGFEGTENGLHLLVEKDFTCLENVAEDQSDNYPNPLAQQKVES